MESVTPARVTLLSWPPFRLAIAVHFTSCLLHHCSRRCGREDHPGAGNMHENARLLEKFFTSVQADDHEAVAACYHPAATFKDIAFDLPDRKMIHAMWHMITETDLQLSYTIERVDERNGAARWVADYTFGDTGRKVHNNLKSHFTFKDGLILEHVDDCDAWNWGMQALGPVNGFVSWLVPAVRHGKAMGKLRNFIERHPQYQ
jgi:ketosteroid isomerase-like protein